MVVLLVGEGSGGRGRVKVKVSEGALRWSLDRQPAYSPRQNRRAGPGLAARPGAHPA